MKYIRMTPNKQKRTRHPSLPLRPNTTTQEWERDKRHGKGTFWVREGRNLRKQYAGDWKGREPRKYSGDTTSMNLYMDSPKTKLQLAVLNWLQMPYMSYQRPANSGWCPDSYSHPLASLTGDGLRHVCSAYDVMSGWGPSTVLTAESDQVKPIDIIQETPYMLPGIFCRPCHRR